MGTFNSQEAHMLFETNVRIITNMFNHVYITLLPASSQSAGSQKSLKRTTGDLRSEMVKAMMFQKQFYELKVKKKTCAVNTSSIVLDLVYSKY